jgi:poly-gamma-glutamate capsule biosynthesis protein CapA/YwtB (metallophosphatase superfamily)
MPGPTLQTANRRSLRTAAQRRRRHTLTLAFAAFALVVVLGGTGWAVVSATQTRRAASAAPAALAGGSQVASAPTAASGGVDAQPTAPEGAVTPTSAPGATAAATSSAGAARSGPATLTVAAVGDMIFDRRVKALIAKSGGAAPLARVAKRLRKADLTVGNLESPLSDGGTKAAKKDVTFRGDPAAIEGLTAAGFDFLSLGNNHVLDYGAEALADTTAALDDAGIAHAGAGKNQKAAWKPGVVETGDDSTAYLSFSFVVPPGFVAQADRAGLASGRWDVSLIEDAIRKAKRTHDYVIVSFHWGVEYKDNANAEQVKVAHRSVDAGADMVLSHHPHVIQGLEIYKKRLIAYSLGDFVFDHYSRKTGESFIVNAEMGPSGVANITITPTYLDGYGRPAVVRGDEAAVILKRLKKISKPHGTTIVISGDTATVKQ